MTFGFYMQFFLVKLVSKCLEVYIFHYILVGDLDNPSLSHVEFGRLHHPGDMTQRVSKKDCAAAIDGMTPAPKT